MTFGAWLRRLPPPGMLAVMYIILILLGAGALMLPLATTQAISWSDAVFTSASAVTVTGLIAVDTATVFTHFGQSVIMVLMQVGGLGLMTFGALLLAALGIPIGIPQRIVLREDLNQTSLTNLMALVRIILKFALIFEGVAIVLLAWVFVPDHGWAQGLWHALFHAVSAFNNAGFSSFSNSLMSYQDNLVVTLTVPALFILSGIGFIVMAEVSQTRSWRRLSLHSKLMLAGTPVLIGVGVMMFALLEWSNPATLAGIDSLSGKVQAAFFQGVTPRTAGFNTIDTAEIHDSTALITMGLMFIGGGSTSTAGGIKVTTAIVLVMATLAFFRRRKELSAFNRAIGVEEVQKVMALLTVSIIVLFTAIFVLVARQEGEFMVLAFEVVSAFGTVGLSMGTTAELDDPSRAAIIVVMFLGRVGPLVLGFFLATQAVPHVRYPKGQVYLG